MKIYSIYDNQTATYAPVFSVPHEMLAVRAFINLAQDRNSQIYAHPSAFNLMELASMDMETGMITPLAAPGTWVSRPLSRSRIAKMPAKKLMFSLANKGNAKKMCFYASIWEKQLRRISPHFKSHAAYNPILSHDVRVAASSW